MYFKRNLYELMDYRAIYGSKKCINEGLLCKVYSLDSESRKGKELERFAGNSIKEIAEDIVTSGWVPGYHDGYSTIGVPKDEGSKLCPLKLKPLKVKQINEFQSRLIRQFEMSKN